MLNLKRISNLGEALRDAMLTFKSNTALIEASRDRESGRWTYQEVRSEAERITALLQEKDVQPGDPVAILMSNQARWPISAAAVFWTGGILVPLDYKLTAEEQIELLKHSKSKVLITEWHIFQRLQKASLDTKNLTVFVTEAPKNVELHSGIRWETATSKAADFQKRAREDIACIVYSSGTGGTPKGCMLTHANYLSQSEQLSSIFPSDEDVRFFSILPTNHAIDFMLGFVYQFLFGATVIHQRTLRPEFVKSTMKRYEITHIALVPMLLKNIEKGIREKMEELPDWKQKIFNSLVSVNEVATQRRPNVELSRRLLKPIHDEFGGKLRLIVTGGTFVEPDTAEFFYRLGIPIAIGYGLTESCTVLTVNDLKPFRSDTVGQPVNGNKIEIRERNESGIGEVWVKGPTVMKGYWQEPELTKETIVEDWLRTGDLGRFDVSGHLRLLGRKKNMIVTEGGKNIYPEDIENAFADIDGCDDNCVFSENFVWPTSKMTNEKLIAVLRLAEENDKEQAVRELRLRNQKLPDYKRVSGYVVWKDEFPKTASMKVKREELAKRMRQALKRESGVKTL